MSQLKLQSRLDSAAALLVEELIDKLQAGEVDVEGFLAAHPEHADTLRRLLPALRALADLSSSASEEHGACTSDLAPLGELGDFRIVREIGRGGMGVVYEAEQMSLCRRVALKMLPFAAALEPKQLQRFRNEALAAASLHHQHIIPIHAVGCERGIHFYVMQFVEGCTLAQLIKALQPAEDQSAAETAATLDVQPGSRSATLALAGLSTDRSQPPGRPYYRRVAELMVQAAEALEHAHGLGIVHRDVQPGNLLVDQAGKLWVGDFGLARFGAGAGLTMSGDLLGTLRYMAPEQAMARHGLVDHRADVYSLGATLYELLTLRPAVTGTERAEVLRQVAFEEPLPPRKLDRAIPVELETIALKALEKNPAERYGTAQELADDLRQFLEDRPIRARRPSLVLRSRKWARRHRAVVTAAAVVAVLALLGSTLSTMLIWSAYDGEAEQRRLAEIAGANEREQRQLAEQRQAAAEKSAAAERVATAQAQKRLRQVEKGTEILASVFENLDPTAEQKEAVSLRVLLGRRLSEAVRQLEGEAVADAVVVAKLQTLLGRSLGQLGHYEQAELVLKKARRTLEAGLEADHPDTLSTRHHLASLYHSQGKYAEAETLFKEVVAAQTANLGADHPDTLTSKHDLAFLYQDQGKYPEAKRLYKDVLEVRTAKLGADHLGTVVTKHNLASIYEQLAKYPQAETLHKEVLEVETAKLGADHPQTLAAKNNLALLYERQGKYAEAETLFNQALELLTAKVGPDHPLSLATKNNLAELYGRQGNYSQAETLYKEVLDVAPGKLGADHPDTLSTKCNLARVYAHQWKYPQAETLYKEALQGGAARLGANHPQTLTTKTGLASVYQAQQKYEQAETLYKEALEGQAATLGANHPATLITKNDLGILYQSQGRYAEAETLFNAVLEGQTARLGAEHPDTLTTKNSLAVLYWRMKKLDRSIPLFEDVVEHHKKVLGPDHPHTLLALANLGINYRDAGRLDEGIRCLEEAFASIRSHVGPIPANLTWILDALVQTYDGARQFAKTEALYRAMLPQIRRQHGADDPRTAAVMAQLGLNLLVQKKHSEAEPILRECLALRAAKQPDDWRTFNTKSMLGGALLGHKKYAEAEPLLLEGFQGMKDREKTIPPPFNKIRLSEAVERLVQLCEARQQPEKARAWRDKLNAGKEE
jgi:serine/threonine protein kinase/tetratricopeptide (TPR) repeat protein